MWKLKKPNFSEVTEQRQSDFDTVFEVKPLERGFGHTMGFALRRTMLGLLSSFAICGVKISDVEHEFQAIEGIVEDGVELILTLKDIKFKMSKEPTEEQKKQIYSFYAKMDPDAKVLRVSDFEFNHSLKPINPKQIIAHAASNLAQRKNPLEIEIFVRFDKGFTDFQENKTFYNRQMIKVDSKIQNGRFVAVDSDFSPVQNVVFKVQELNSSSNDIEECLTMQVKTDGRITSRDALQMASEILAGGFLLANKMEENLEEKLFIEDSYKNNKIDIYNDPIVRIGLSKRAENALKGENINTVQDLMNYENLEMIENIGKKTAQEIRDKLKLYLEKQNFNKGELAFMLEEELENTNEEEEDSL